MTHPLYTVFPPVYRNVWPVNHPSITPCGGHWQSDLWYVERKALATKGPHINLSTGMFGIEFQLSPTEPGLDPDLQIATVQVTSNDGQDILTKQPVHIRDIDRAFAGMYHGVRLNLVIDHWTNDVEWRVISTGTAPFLVHGFKLIPRPGRIWFVENLERDPDQWRIHPDRSGSCLSPTTVHTPGYTLDAGEYRVGIKLKPPPGMTTGDLADIEAIGVSITSGPRTIVPVKRVTAEDVLARFGIPDSKMRFRLDEPHSDIQLRISALVSGMTIQWLRLATADESVWQHYYNLGGLDSPLGPPSGGYLPDIASRKYIHGSRRDFSSGTIYWTIQHGPCQVFGEIGDIYDRAGGTSGPLGFPITRPQPVTLSGGKSGMIQYFESGGRQSAILTIKGDHSI